MIGTIGYLLVLCFVLVNLREAFGQTIPFNAVAESGGEVIFNCSRSSFRPNWFMSKDGTTTNQLPIAGSCVVSNGLENHYRTDPTGEPTVCNLVVFNVTIEQAGVYWCTDGVAAYALLTILEKTPSVTYNTTENVAVENENVIITCTLIYSGSASPASTLRPYFNWTDLNGQRINGSYESTTESMALSHISVTAGRHNITPYTCHVYLQLNPTTNPNYASNTPVVSKRSVSPTIEVLFSPSAPNITIQHAVIMVNDVACEVNVLTCNSTGIPSPNYEWFDVEESLNYPISTEQTLTLAEVTRNYVCRAFNTIRTVIQQQNTSANNTESTATGFPYCKFPRKSIVSNVTGDCSKESGISLTCTAYSSYPNASYMWLGADGNHVKDSVYSGIKKNGVYKCIAYFDRPTSNYSGSLPFPNGKSQESVESCYVPVPVATIVLAVVLGSYGLCNIIAMVVFLVYYNHKSNSVSDERDDSRFRNKMRLNARFSWLQRMLPCMNISAGNSGCNFHWVILFVFMSILFGIIIFPILIIMVNCSRKSNNLKGTTDIDMREQVHANDRAHGVSPNSKAAGNPSTAAHGDVGDYYDEIGTNVHNRKHVLEDDSDISKGDKKVFYTRVNPNGNTDEDVTRYCVTPTDTTR